MRTGVHPACCSSPCEAPFECSKPKMSLLTLRPIRCSMLLGPSSQDPPSSWHPSAGTPPLGIDVQLGHSADVDDAGFTGPVCSHH